MKAALLEFIQNYGYWAVFLGALIEGESIILTSSAMAAAGYFSIYKIMLIAFGGTVLADQGLYILGYTYGEPVLCWIRAHLPKMARYMDKALMFLHRYQNAYILSFRFIWGVRIISSVIIGAQKIPPLRFAVLNIIAAVLWTVISCMAGYLLGETVLYIFHTYGAAIGASIAGLILSVAIIWKYVSYRRRTQAP